MLNGSKNREYDPDILAKDAVRYYKNAKGQIAKSKIILGEFYEDRKYVVEAAGVLWIAIQLAMKAFFLRQGVHNKSLPESEEAYSAMLRKHSTHNGKLVITFQKLYQIVHLNAYYGRMNIVADIKDGFGLARHFIETLTGEKIA